MKTYSKYIDNGKGFDWGKVSDDYAKYRDIYPNEFYRKILERGLCINGQNILDIGTGTGVLPRNMYKYGGKWVGIDVQPNQIEKAKNLSENMDIDYFVSAVEDIDLPEKSFDVVTAAQCFWYFDSVKTPPILNKLLKDNGRLLLLYMAWLPLEDKIAGASEKLVLKYSPNWSGANETVHKIAFPKEYESYFDLTYHEEFPVNVHFTKASWHGRMKTCRGVGASLSQAQIQQWEKEHLELLDKIAPNEFEVLHYIAISEFKKKR